MNATPQRALAALVLGAWALATGCSPPPPAVECAEDPCPLLTSCDRQSGLCVPVDESGTVASDMPSLAVDSRGRVLLAGYARERGDLVLGIWDEAAARFRYQTVDSAGDVGRYPALVVLSDDRPAIAYFDATNNAAKLALLETDGSWRVESIDATSSVGSDCDLAVDDDDVLHVAYRDLTYRALRYAKRVDGIWRIEYVDTGSDEKLPVESVCPAEQRKKAKRGVGFDAHIVVQGATPVISYFDADCGALRLARKAASEWSLQVLDGWDASRYTGPSAEPPTEVGRFNDLALDLQGNLAIAYFEGPSGVLKVVRFEAGLPIIELADDGLRRSEGEVVRKHIVGQNPSIAFDGDMAIVAHLDAAGPQALLSTRVGNGWVTEAPSTPSEGFEPELVVTVNGRRYLASVDKIAAPAQPITLFASTRTP